MRITNKSIRILSILSVRSCSLRELIIAYQTLSRDIFKSYHSLRQTIIIMTKNLLREKLIKREGTRGRYIYSITCEGMQQLIRHNLKRIITI